MDRYDEYELDRRGEPGEYPAPSIAATGAFKPPTRTYVGRCRSVESLQCRHPRHRSPQGCPVCDCPRALAANHYRQLLADKLIALEKAADEKERLARVAQLVALARAEMLTRLGRDSPS